MAAKMLIGTDRPAWNSETPTQATAFGSGFLSSISAPSTNATTGVYRASPDPATADTQFNQIAAFFFATSSLVNKTAKARIWGVSQVGTGNNYVGVILGELTLTLGTVVGVGLYATTKFVKAISVDIDSSSLPPGIRILGDDGDRAAMLLIDAVGFQYIMIELRNVDLGTSEFVGVAWRSL